jgi:hypothetical protein
MNQLTGKDILKIKMCHNDIKAKTIKDYLKSLIYTLWAEGEGFSGKHPFGNSGWEYELYLPLVVAKVVEGTLDSYGYLNEFDEKTANELIFQAIEAL